MKINKDCPYSDKTCTIQLHCLKCAYDYLIKQESYDEADKLYVTFEKWMTGVTRHSVRHDGLRRKLSQPTENQLKRIKLLFGQVPEGLDYNKAEQLIRSGGKAK